MSSLQNPTAAYKQQFHDTFNSALAQTQSRLRGTVNDRGTIDGASFTINNIGTTEMEAVGGRYEDKRPGQLGNATRVVYMADFDKNLVVDGFDIPKLAADPTYKYADELVAAANRRTDKTIYRALLDAVLEKYTEGGTFSQISLPATQMIAAGGTAFTKAKAIYVRSLFRRNEADGENNMDDPITILWDDNMLRQILSDTTLTSADYLTVGMLQEGKVAGKWLGMNWVPYQALDKPVAGTTRTVAYTKSAVDYGVGIETKTRIGENQQKRGHPVEAYAWMSMGAGRQDEKKVVQIDFLDA